MLTNFFKKEKILYINDRHEEADTEKEDRKKLYDKRILPLLGGDAYAIFGEKIDRFLLGYYKSLGLSGLDLGKVFYVDSYVNFPSLTQAILHDGPLIEKLKKERFDLIVPYIESENTGILADRIGAPLFRKSDITSRMNNKAFYRQVAQKLKVPTAEGFVSDHRMAEKYFIKIKNFGFKKIVLKKFRSVAGFGVFVADNINNLRKYLKDYFADEKKFIMEGFVRDIILRPNIQYFISPDEIIFIGITDQLIGEDSTSYEGSYAPLEVDNPHTLQSVKDFSLKICEYLQKNQGYGFVGIDWIITKNGDLYSLEANTRFNASTFPLLLIKRLFNNDSQNIYWWYRTMTSASPVSFSSLFGHFDGFITKKKKTGILPLGVDLINLTGEGQFVGVGRTRQEAMEHYSKFRKFFKYHDGIRQKRAADKR